MGAKHLDAKKSLVSPNVVAPLLSGYMVVLATSLSTQGNNEKLDPSKLVEVAVDATDASVGIRSDSWFGAPLACLKPTF